MPSSCICHAFGMHWVFDFITSGYFSVTIMMKCQHQLNVVVVQSVRAPLARPPDAAIPGHLISLLTLPAVGLIPFSVLNQNMLSGSCSLIPNKTAWNNWTRKPVRTKAQDEHLDADRSESVQFAFDERRNLLDTHFTFLAKVSPPEKSLVPWGCCHVSCCDWMDLLKKACVGLE